MDALQVFLAWKLCTGGGGIGMARERDIELLMDAEREIAREMGWDPFSDGIFLSVLHVVRCEHVW